MLQPRLALEKKGSRQDAKAPRRIINLLNYYKSRRQFSYSLPEWPRRNENETSSWWGENYKRLAWGLAGTDVSFPVFADDALMQSALTATSAFSMEVWAVSLAIVGILLYKLRDAKQLYAPKPVADIEPTWARVIQSELSYFSSLYNDKSQVPGQSAMGLEIQVLAFQNGPFATARYYWCIFCRRWLALLGVIYLGGLFAFDIYLDLDGWTLGLIAVASGLLALLLLEPQTHQRAMHHASRPINHVKGNVVVNLAAIAGQAKPLKLSPESLLRGLLFHALAKDVFAEQPWFAAYLDEMRQRELNLLTHNETTLAIIGAARSLINNQTPSSDYFEMSRRLSQTLKNRHDKSLPKEDYPGYYHGHMLFLLVLHLTKGDLMLARQIGEHLYAGEPLEEAMIKAAISPEVLSLRRRSFGLLKNGIKPLTINHYFDHVLGGEGLLPLDEELVSIHGSLKRVRSQIPVDKQCRMVISLNLVSFINDLAQLTEEAWTPAITARVRGIIGLFMNTGILDHDRQVHLFTGLRDNSSASMGKQIADQALWQLSLHKDLTDEKPRLATSLTREVIGDLKHFLTAEPKQPSLETSLASSDIGKRRLLIMKAATFQKQSPGLFIRAVIYLQQKQQRRQPLRVICDELKEIDRDERARLAEAQTWWQDNQDTMPTSLLESAVTIATHKTTGRDWGNNPLRANDKLEHFLIDFYYTPAERSNAWLTRDNWEKVAYYLSFPKKEGFHPHVFEAAELFQPSPYQDYSTLYTGLNYAKRWVSTGDYHLEMLQGLIGIPDGKMSKDLAKAFRRQAWERVQNQQGFKAATRTYILFLLCRQLADQGQKQELRIDENAIIRAVVSALKVSLENAAIPLREKTAPPEGPNITSFKVRNERGPIQLPPAIGDLGEILQASPNQTGLREGVFATVNNLPLARHGTEALDRRLGLGLAEKNNL